jgi:hypothetical protein
MVSKARRMLESNVVAIERQWVSGVVRIKCVARTAEKEMHKRKEAACVSSKAINFSRRESDCLEVFVRQKGTQCQGAPRAHPKWRGRTGVTGIAAGEDPERRGQGDEREWSNL